MSQKNWYAIHTLSCREAVAAGAIISKGIESFLPQTRERKPDGVGKWKTVVKPLFPRYLFTYTEQEALSLVKRLQGVAYVVGFDDCPLSVPEFVIEEIRSRMVGGFVELEEREPECPFRLNDEVIINKGVMQGIEGLFKQWIPGKQKVGILLNFLGREQVISFDLAAVSPISIYQDVY